LPFSTFFATLRFSNAVFLVPEVAVVLVVLVMVSVLVAVVDVMVIVSDVTVPVVLV
jgi:hypothetical protein